MNYYSFFPSHFNPYKRKYKRTQKNKSKTFEKNQQKTFPQPETFPPTEEIQKNQQIMDILKPYHNPKKYTYYHY